MAYEKQNFKDGEVLRAFQLNKIEDGIADVNDLLQIKTGLITTTISVDEVIDGYLKSTTALEYGPFNKTLKYDISKQETNVIVVNSTDTNIVGYSAYKMLFTDKDGNILSGDSAGEKLVYGEDIEIDVPSGATYFYLSSSST